MAGEKGKAVSQLRKSAAQSVVRDNMGGKVTTYVGTQKPAQAVVKPVDTGSAAAAKAAQAAADKQYEANRAAKAKADAEAKAKAESVKSKAMVGGAVVKPSAMEVLYGSKAKKK